ncbi:MAG: tRNA preQ1(34) S-adenosylmethionine ribosyltransferase-isomerase QueA [Clostridia bacterium]|nr:tRNA preQ1(34) S-adenosylmethionine ribosyltransferase-isomerase QueA [Clostridia bacterium]
MPTVPDLTRLDSYWYDLPPELIAQTPVEKRDSSRLLVLDRQNGGITHGVFTDILNCFNPGDALVINDTKVIPARIMGKNPRHAGEIETLLLERAEGDEWNCLVKPGKKARANDVIEYSPALRGVVTAVNEEDGSRRIRFEYTGNFLAILDSIGAMPLPPYIKEKLKDRDRYQTVYAKREGSAAAPTAGLHFTPELLEKIKEKGVRVVRVLLHVGLGTFRPVKERNILEHKMHTERIELSAEAAEELNSVRRNGGRIIAVGTTSCRLLESCADENGVLAPYSGETGIFIYPGYKFRAVDSLITNFHLPESTLIMLVSAFAGYENTMRAYNEAVKERYRFFSFGDAMFIR